MKKKLIFEVEEGGIENCADCPFGVWDTDKGYLCGNKTEILDCVKYDLATLKFIGEEYDNEHKGEPGKN